MLNKDHEATAAAQFQDRRSKVLLDGRERLSGKDVTKRREEVFEASGGKCAACGRRISWEWFEMHHKQRKSALRDRLQGRDSKTCIAGWPRMTNPKLAGVAAQPPVATTHAVSARFRINRSEFGVAEEGR